MIEFSVIDIEETSSTSDEIKRLAALGHPEGTVVTARRQTAGRGRSGKAWGSLPGGLFFSLLLRPAEIEPGLITLSAGVAVAETLRGFGVSAGLKWPNDVMANGKKICGILAETSTAGASASVALGIGVNVNTPAFPPPIDEVATSALLETGNSFDEKAVLGRILEVFGALYGTNKNEIIAGYRDMCLNIGRTVIITKAVTGERITGEALDVDADGGLLVRPLDGGALVTVNSGEVSLRDR